MAIVNDTGMGCADFDGGLAGVRADNVGDAAAVRLLLRPFCFERRSADFDRGPLVEVVVPVNAPGSDSSVVVVPSLPGSHCPSSLSSVLFGIPSTSSSSSLDFPFFPFFFFFFFALAVAAAAAATAAAAPVKPFTTSIWVCV